MKISKRGEYGIRALCYLADRHDAGLVHVKQIADDEAIPGKFLEGILLELKRAGFVTSRRGNEGGYALAKDPGEIRLGELIRALDGPLAPMGSAAELQDRIRSVPRQAGLFAILMDVRNAVASILDETSLSDVVRRNREESSRDGSSSSSRGRAPSPNDSIRFDSGEARSRGNALRDRE